MKSIDEIAKANKVDASYVGRLLNLTLLDPTMVEAICFGREPAGFSLARLTRKLPSNWFDQCDALGLDIR
jgi:hypothetical protein